MGSQHCYEPHRIGKVGEGIVHHAAVKIARKLRRLHITADKAYIVLLKLCFCNRYHFRRNIYSRNGFDLTFKIVGNEHARAACDIEHLNAVFYAAVIKNNAYNFIVAYKLGIP